MDEIILPYGKKTIKIKRPSNLLAILEPREGVAIDIAASLKKVLEEPIATPPLKNLIKRGDRIAIVIPDKTRRSPLKEILPLILDELESCGIKEINLIIGNALHCHHPLSEFEFGDDILKRVKIHHHDGRKKQDMAKIGEIDSPESSFFLKEAFTELIKLPFLMPRAMYNAILKREHILAPFLKIGMLTCLGVGVKKEVWINKIVNEADLVIVIGAVIPHLMAGFSGGAKGIIPGVAAVKAIAFNHFLMLHPASRLGKAEGNILREDLEKGAGLLKNVFIVNAIYDRDKRVIGFVGGDMIKAHREGVKICREIGEVEAKKADIVISCDGFPETINIYQTIKLIAPAARMVNRGGAIIVAGECPAGEGELSLFNRIFYWLLLKQVLPYGVTIYLLSETQKTKNFPFFLTPVTSIEEGIECGTKKIGNSPSILILSGAGLLIPR